MEFPILDALEPVTLRLLAFIGPITGFLVPAIFEFVRVQIRKYRKQRELVNKGAQEQRETELKRDEELDKEARQIHEENRSKPDVDLDRNLSRWL